MSNDSLPEKCDCEEVDKCIRMGVCCCTNYCGRYARTLAEYITPVYVTISPNPHEITTYEALQESMKTGIFYKLAKASRDCICVLELAGCRPHYHCLFDVKDKVGFNIRLLNYSKYSNAKKHNKFKGGYHYLFKDVDITREETEIEPILSYEKIIEYNVKKKKETKLKREGEVKSVNRLPIWMSNCNYDENASCEALDEES